MTVTFDKPLEPGPLDVSNWLVLGVGSGSVVAATSAASTVVLEMDEIFNPVQVEYSPPPFDVVGVNGLAVEAFSLPI